MATKSFKQMNKEELIAAAISLKLIDKVKETAKDVDNITNAEYVTVLEAFKAAQDEVNSDTKTELEEIQKVEKVKATEDSSEPKVIKTTVNEQS